MGAESSEDTRADTAKGTLCFPCQPGFLMSEEWIRVLCVGSAVCTFILLISNSASLGKLRKPKTLKIIEISFSQTIVSCGSCCS